MTVPIISLATCPKASWSISWDMGLCPLRWKMRESNEIIFQVFPTEKIQVLTASRVCNGRLGLNSQLSPLQSRQSAFSRNTGKKQQGHILVSIHSYFQKITQPVVILLTLENNLPQSPLMIILDDHIKEYHFAIKQKTLSKSLNFVSFRNKLRGNHDRYYRNIMVFFTLNDSS